MNRFMKFIILVALLLTGCANKEISEDTKIFKEEYEALNNSGIVVNIEDEDIDILDYNEAYNLLTTGTGVIYFGFPSCPWCRNIVPVLLDVLDKNNETLNYVNIRNLSNDNYLKVKELLNEYLTVESNGERIFYFPDVYFVKDGKIIGHHIGSVKTQTNPNVSMDKKQKKELSNIYKELLKEMEK